MHKGRKKDHKWFFVKFKGNACIYAKCSCGFRYPCNEKEGDGLKFVPAPERLYPYCPICGSRKKYYEKDVRKIDKYWYE